VARSRLNSVYWPVYIAPYVDAVKNDAVMTHANLSNGITVLRGCPAFRESSDYDPADTTNMGFGMNHHLKNPQKDPSNKFWSNAIPGGTNEVFCEFHFAAIRNASSRPLVGDTNTWQFGMSSLSSRPPRHGQKVQMVMCDGHVGDIEVAPGDKVYQLVADPTKY